MQFRRRMGTIIVVLILLTYAGALRMLKPRTLTDTRLAEAQGYPEPSATQAAYPPPALPTAPVHPTSTPRPATPSPVVHVTPSIVLTQPALTRQPTFSPIATAVVGSATPTATSTSGVIIVLPPTATRRASVTASAPAVQQAAPAPAWAFTATIAATEEPIQTPTIESDLPSADLLPPVADRQSGPGVAFTLLAGAVLAAIAWWVWRRWLASGADVTPHNPDDPR